MYKFFYNGREYELNEEKFIDIINDEEKPVEEFEVDEALRLLNECGEVDFSRKYYGDPCEECLKGKAENEKFFSFLEYHFYIFTRNNKYIISNISKQYENTSFNKLLREGKVDNSYIVSVIVCENCEHFSIEIEQCEI